MISHSIQESQGDDRMMDSTGIISRNVFDDGTDENISGCQS